MLQTLFTLLIFAANLVQAAWNEYEEKRNLELDADEVETLQIESGAGSLDIAGAAGERITVGAVIRVPGADEDEARQLITDDMVLSLERNGRRAVLNSWFEQGSGLFRDSPSIDLEVGVPEGMALAIKDGSGSLAVRNVRGDIELEDGSGSIELSEVGGTLKVRDGSGSLLIEGAGGDVFVVDGSGSVTVMRVDGSVTIEDGSGSVEVREVLGDLTIPEDGSGSVDFSGISGRVEHSD